MTLRLPFVPAVSRFRNRVREARALLNLIGCSPWQRLCLFDVGANDGSTFGELSRLLPWSKFYAFEPTPELVTQINRRFGHNRNFHLVPKAVGETPGTARFNVAGQADWGCSSLLEFSSDLEKTWPGRTDFKVTQHIDVEIIRLDEFIREQRIPRIDFLHVDTQGTDLSVLRSLGSEISRVAAGVIEVPQNREVMLYKGQHTREEAVAFLAENGFEIWKTVSQQNEDNLFFRRKPSSSRI